VNKKEAKKTLLPWDVTAAVSHTREAEQKFFASFFKKEGLAFFPKYANSTSP
jgi:hypothetical protein